MKFWGFRTQKERNDAHMDQVRAAAYLQSQGRGSSSSNDSGSSGSGGFREMAQDRCNLIQHQLDQIQDVRQYAKTPEELDKLNEEQDRLNREQANLWNTRF
jgi:hypothetical protein